MILILSTNIHELSTEDVMDWLHYWKSPFVRVNGESITEDNFYLHIGNDGARDYAGALTGKTPPVAVVWYRRWHKRLSVEALKPALDTDAVVNLRKHLNNEIGIVTNFFFNQFPNASWIDPPRQVHLNKLTVLSLAVASGLTIPDTIVATTKKHVEDFFQKHPRLITKPIGEVTVFSTHNEHFGMDTKEIDLETVRNLGSDTFFPSLVQALIVKEFDIRIFYLDNTFYSMAILSQRRKASSIDFRNYDYQNPDRKLPFKLPENIENKLRKLIEKVNLQHCSIDMIKSIDGQYVFLEINPVGQFGMVSKPCNYHLEMQVAQYLKTAAEAHQPAEIH